MQDLEVVVQQTAGKIDCNLDEIKEAVAIQMSAYTSLEVSEDNIAERKKDLATLRKIYKAVDDKKKSIKKEFLAPYEQFESQVKDVLAVINEPITLIDGKLKEFDAIRAKEKKQHVQELYNESIGEFAEYLPLEKIFNEKWLNKSTTDKDILFDLSEQKTKVKSAIDVIKSLNSEIEDELLTVYRNNDNDLATAIKRNTDYLADKARIEAASKEEKKPSAEAMGTLNDVAKAFNTVKFVISASDREEVETILGFNGIKYQILED